MNCKNELNNQWTQEEQGLGTSVYNYLSNLEISYSHLVLDIGNYLMFTAIIIEERNVKRNCFLLTLHT